MAERTRLLLELAIVTAVVGGTAAAVVTECGGTNDEAFEHGRLPPPPTLTSAQAPPVEVASVAPPPTTTTTVPPVSESAAPPAPPPKPSLADLLESSIEWGAPIDVTGAVDGGAPHRAEVVEADAGVAVAVAAQEPEAPSQADAGAANATALRGPTFSAGAGRFSTEPPSWAASAWTTNPQAGAGPFITEQTTPSGGFFLFPFPPLFAVPFPSATEDGSGTAGGGLEGADPGGGVGAPQVFEPFELPPP